MTNSGMVVKKIVYILSYNKLCQQEIQQCLYKQSFNKQKLISHIVFSIYNGNILRIKVQIFRYILALKHLHIFLNILPRMEFILLT